MRDVKVPVATVNETTALISNDGVLFLVPKPQDERTVEDDANESADKTDPDSASTLSTIAVLLIGVFVANSDTSLVLATYGKISSDFSDLERGSWLLTAYVLSMCAAQPLYGKLSNIYGRKPVLLTTYVLFGLGSAICGLGKSMNQLILGRIMGGAGGAGMISLVSILITDIVPLREVALYRSYVNVVQTVGKSVGGPLGGYIAESLGWRWSFFLQCPVALSAFILVAWKLQLPKHITHVDESNYTKLKRVDFVGSACLSISIVGCLLSFDLFGRARSWLDPVPIVSLSVGVGMMVAFCLVETFYAKEPIFPLELLAKRDTCTTYLILAFQNAAQTAMMFCVPLYFQVTRRATPGEAGTCLLPAVVGNMIGGLSTGAYIRRTGRYKAPAILSGLFSATAYSLLLVRWRGQTNAWESLYIWPGGLGTGVAHSSAFIALAASVSEEDLAITGSGLYLLGNVGSLIGLSITSSIFQWAVKNGLNRTLAGVDNSIEIARRALSDVNYVNALQGRIHELVVDGYLKGFQSTFFISLICAASCLLTSLFIRQHKLR